jgi:hypothetical protein
MDKKLLGLKRFIGLFLILMLFGNACNLLNNIQQNSSEKTVEVQPNEDTPVPNATKTETTVIRPTQTPGAKFIVDPLLVFAKFQEPKVDLKPAAEQSETPPNWDEIYNPFILSTQQMEQMQADGFVVSPGNEKEFFTLYEKARYDNLPIFVTSDSLLHSYHLLFDKVLRTAEMEHFIPLLLDLNQAMLITLDEQYQQLRGTSWEDSALRSVAYMGVGARLLDPSVQVPSYTEDLVSQELALIEAASGMMPSPIFPYLRYGEDYTQYIPRGHYTLNESLKAYFRSMMWYGRMTFRLVGDDPEYGKAETRSALLIVQAVRNTLVNGHPAVEAWADLYSPTVFFVGRSDDLNLLQYGEVIDQIYGANPSLTTLADDSQLDAFINLANQLPAPRILGIVIAYTDDEIKSTKGLRFMGQRFVPDAYVFRELVFRNVGTVDNRRGLPMGMDLMAAMSSDRAYHILDELGETSYENYPEQMQKMQDWISGVSVAEWTETLYNTWIYSFYPLIDVPGRGYPFFMQSEAWLDKQLNASLGSWAELKHDTILYAKQVYAELGGGPPAPSPIPPRGYVEPVPQFFARLAALTSMTLDGLDSRSMLSELDRASLQSLEELALSLKAIAEKELSGQPLSQDDYDLILYYGGDLEKFVMASADSDTEDPFAPRFMDEQPQAAVIADVATDPGSDEGLVVLEEGVGRINEIHVLVPLTLENGSTFWQVAKGGVFSYYEFRWPGSDRLTDEKWRVMLDDGSAPDLPSWTGSFYLNQGEYAEQRQAVFNYQDRITNALWFNSYMDPAEVANAGYFKDEFDQLQKQGRYMGHQLVGSDFASFDLQSDSLAVVTVIETWQDKLYVGDYPDFIDPISERGPYQLTATYQLQIDQNTWTVVNVDYNQRPPEWQN